MSLHSLPPPPPLNVSLPSSPRSSTLPSPPDSPSSVSSLPSVSSSFFFSSAAASPRHPFGASLSHHHHHHPHIHSAVQSVRDDPSDTQGLIIPSLTLPSALRRPTPFGQTLGDLRLLVLGTKGAARRLLEGLLLEENEHIVEVGEWEHYFSQDPIDDADAAENGLLGHAHKGPDIASATSNVKVLRASTDWFEHRDAHGLEKFEPIRNVELVEVSGYDPAASPTDVQSLLNTIKAVIHDPFQNVVDVLHPDHRPSTVLANLVSSPLTPLFTALIFLLPTAPTSVDHQILKALSSEIPIIVLPRLSSHSSHSRPISRKPSKVSLQAQSQAPNVRLSTFQPSSAIALRTGLFNSPETLALLRSEATDRFLSWREVEREVEIILHKRAYDPVRQDVLHWNKTRWEAEWESELSVHVARRLREESELLQTIRPSDSQPGLFLATAPIGSVHRESDHATASPITDSSVPASPATGIAFPKSYDALEGGYDFDPLHLPSLVIFSLALLGPLQDKIEKTITRIVAGTFGRLTATGDETNLPMTSENEQLDRIVAMGRRRNRPTYEEGGFYGRDGLSRPGGAGGASAAVKVALVFSVGVGVGMMLK